MASENVLDWDGAYRGDAGFDGPPPWNIGEPQPELAALHQAGKFRSDVLDAGCGHAELSLALAADGYTNLSTASFVQGDITSFTGYDRRFSTVVDSTLFHSLPVEGRDGYLKSIHRASVPGAGYYVLVFAKGAFPAELDEKPNEVDEAELRAAVSKHWEIDEIRPAFIHANAMAMPTDVPFELPAHDHDEQGRIKFPAFLLTAHKPG